MQNAKNSDNMFAFHFGIFAAGKNGKCSEGYSVTYFKSIMTGSFLNNV